MATIRKEILTKAPAGSVWDAIRDIGALHTRLVPGFVTATRLEPGARVVTFANGETVREPIVSLDDDAMRLVWSAETPRMTHYNGAAQVHAAEGLTRVVWTADFLPDEAGDFMDAVMEAGAQAMKSALDQLADTA